MPWSHSWKSVLTGSQVRSYQHCIWSQYDNQKTTSEDQGWQSVYIYMHVFVIEFLLVHTGYVRSQSRKNQGQFHHPRTIRNANSMSLHRKLHTKSWLAGRQYGHFFDLVLTTRGRPSLLASRYRNGGKECTLSAPVADLSMPFSAVGLSLLEASSSSSIYGNRRSDVTIYNRGHVDSGVTYVYWRTGSLWRVPYWQDTNGSYNGCCGSIASWPRWCCWEGVSDLLTLILHVFTESILRLLTLTRRVHTLPHMLYLIYWNYTRNLPSGSHQSHSRQIWRRWQYGTREYFVWQVLRYLNGTSESHVHSS